MVRVKRQAPTLYHDRRSADGLPARFLPAPAGEVTIIVAATAAATATKATAAATAATTAAEPALGLGPCLVDDERAPVHRLLVELRDGLLGLFVSAHFDEGEAAGPPGRHVPHHPHAVDLAGATEQLGELVLRRRVRKIADVKSPAHAVDYSCQIARDCAWGGPPTRTMRGRRSESTRGLRCGRVIGLRRAR